MDYYLFIAQGRIEGCVDLVCWPIVDSLPTKWWLVSRGLDTGLGKSCV